MDHHVAILDQHICLKRLFWIARCPQDATNDAMRAPDTCAVVPIAYRPNTGFVIGDVTIDSDLTPLPERCPDLPRHRQRCGTGRWDVIA